MDIIMEFYDKDVLKNIIAPLSLRPKKVIYFYDKGMEDMNVFTSLRKCLERNILGIEMEYYPVNISTIGKIYEKLELHLERNRGQSVALDLTGGSELMLLAGHRIGMERKIPLLHTDLTQNHIVNLLDEKEVAKVKPLTLEDFLDARGARLMGESHKPPEPERYDQIKTMARYIFSELPKWKDTCNFMQTMVAQASSEDLAMYSKWNIRMKNGKAVAPIQDMLEKFQKLGFIKKLNIYDKNVSFVFCSQEDKKYCINYGVWLELYVYICASEQGFFNDVKLGTMIDWDSYAKMNVAGNEIDVILMDQSMPIFVSCKLRDADTAALNELLIAKKRLGGWYSKGVMVSLSKEKKIHTGTYRRAKELGLEFLDATDIRADDFGERLVRVIKDHDLVDLKWKKI